MFNIFGSRNRHFIASLFCLFVFALFVGSLTTTAGTDTGAKKGCDPKTCTKSCPMMMKASSTSETQADESHAVQIDLKDFNQIEGYTCPMHPAVKSEKSGKCPECGMKLVKGDFYEVYACAMKECTHPCVHPKPGQCCGKDLQKTMMTKDEMYQSARLQDEFFCSMHPDVVSAEPGKCPQCGMKLKMRTVQQLQPESPQMMSYVCPMHPDQLSDKPGDCPKCGMKLRQKTSATEQGKSGM
jgi:hypothetical protein